MEQIVVYKKNGGKIFLNSWGQVSGVTEAEQVMELVGADDLDIAVTSATKLNFEIGDWTEIFGERYQIDALPPTGKNHDRQLVYQIKFRGAKYDLLKTSFLDVAENGISTGSSFDLMCNLETIARVVINNLRRVYGSKWKLGVFPTDTYSENVTFANQNCMDVLTSACDKYEFSFFVVRTGVNEYKIDIKKPDEVLPDVFRYGRAMGLYELSRANVSDKNIVTRLFAYGGTNNIPPNYRGGSLNLKMPYFMIHSEDQPFIQDGDAVAKYGVIEEAVTFEDIYPQRTGKVTAIDSTNRLVFYDNTMDFNLSESINGTTTYLILGMNAKISFITGNLAGYEFDLNGNTGYNHAQKKFTLNAYTDDSGNIFPSQTSSAFQIQVGDEYKILNISMPQSYVIAAEQRLLERAEEYLNDNNKPRIFYELNIDPNYIRSKETIPGGIINYFKPGQKIKVVDPDLDIEGVSTIQSVRRDALNHYHYVLQLGEENPNRAYKRYKATRPTNLTSATGLSAQQAGQVGNIVYEAISSTINLPTPQPRTLKFYIGSGAAPEGFVSTPLTTDSTLQDADLVGAKLFGVQHIDRTVFDFVEDGILFDNSTGTLDFTAFPLYEGEKIIIPVIR